MAVTSRCRGSLSQLTMGEADRPAISSMVAIDFRGSVYCAKLLEDRWPESR